MTLVERIEGLEASVASLAAEAASLRTNDEQQADRIRHLEKIMDTRTASLLKRIVFRVDGWPSWTVVAASPSNRPWRRWWTS